MDGFVHVKDNIYYIPSPTNIGLIVEGNEVVLIDSGNDKDAGRKIRQSLEKNNLTIKAILNTHSNADHIGANNYLMNYYDCPAYSLNREVAFSHYPDLESSLLYGGFPTKEMKNKFLMSKPCDMSNIKDFKHEEIEYFALPGHFLDMIGFKIKDVYFLGDSLFPENIIKKYHLFYIYDIKEFLNTLDYLETINDNRFFYVASHCPITNDIQSLIDLNREKILEITDLILNYLEEEKDFQTILKYIFDHYELKLDLNQYLLCGSTIRNYLSYLKEEKKIEFIFEDNILLYKQIKN